MMNISDLWTNQATDLKNKNACIILYAYWFVLLSAQRGDVIVTSALHDPSYLWLA